MRRTWILSLSLLGLAACTSTTPNKPILLAPEILGHTQSSLERSFSKGKATGKGWIKYNKDLRVRYNEKNKARELSARVPEGMSCLNAARWLGFTQATAPILKSHACSWPSNDPRHSLAPNSSGSLNLKTRFFHAYSH